MAGLSEVLVEPKPGLFKFTIDVVVRDWQWPLSLWHLDVGHEEIVQWKRCTRRWTIIGGIQYFCARVPVDQGIDTSVARLLEMSDLYSSTQVEAD